MSQRSGVLLAGVAVVCAAAFLVAACVEEKRGDSGAGMSNSNNPDQIDLRIGSSEVFGQPVAYGDLGLGTSNKDFDHRRPKHPRVRFVHGAFTLLTPEVDHIDASSEKELGGLTEIKLTLHEPLYGATHEQARDFVYGLMKQVQAAGWKRLIDIGAPRLKGESSMRAAFSDHYGLPSRVSVMHLDPGYLIPIEDMVREGQSGAWSPRFRWQFYADGVELTVGLFDTKFDEKNPDFNTYRVQMAFVSQEARVRLLFPEKDRAKWREMWPAKAAEFAGSRLEREALARQQKLEIDESYQDPPLAPPMADRPLQKGELLPQEQVMPKRLSSLNVLPGDPCPQTGDWIAPALRGRVVHAARGEIMPGPQYSDIGLVIWHLQRA